MKFKFKQNNINAYFNNKATIDFDLEIQRLERERLLEMKRRKELAWTERRREQREELEKRRMRLERAALSTLTARTGSWSIREEGGVQSPKRRRDSDWLTTPSKRSRGDRGREKERNIFLPGASSTAAPTTPPLSATGPAASPPRLLGTGPTSPPLSSTGPPTSLSRSMCTPPSSKLPSTGLSPLLALRKYKCTQAESAPQGLASSGNSSELANKTIAQALTNLLPVVVVQSIDGLTVKMKTTDKPNRSPVQTKIHLFETNVNSETEGGPPKKAPQNIKNIKKRPQVKTRKWVRKKNGLFGWVTSVASQGSGKEPHNFGGVGDTNKSENTEQGKGREDGESAAGKAWSGQ